MKHLWTISLLPMIVVLSGCFPTPDECPPPHLQTVEEYSRWLAGRYPERVYRTDTLPAQVFPTPQAIEQALRDLPCAPIPAALPQGQNLTPTGIATPALLAGLVAAAFATIGDTPTTTATTSTR